MKVAAGSCLLFALVILSSGKCFSQVSELERVSNPSLVLSFADHLYETGDYSRAIGEYKRFIYLSTDRSGLDRAAFRVGVCYERSGHLDNATDWFGAMLEQDSSADSLGSIQYEIGKCYFLGTDYTNALEILRNVDTEKSLLLSGWSMLRQAKYDEASEYFKKIKPDSPFSELSKTLASESLEGDRLSRKSPLLAALLSVPVPGAGRTYCGRAGDGFFSLLLVAGSYVAALEYHEHDEEVLGAGALALGLFFHAGDVYGATISARRFNAASQAEFIGRIENTRNLSGILLE